MKLSISNIAWDKSHDVEIYQYLKETKFQGIEIAPTRLVEHAPYDYIEKSVDMVNQIRRNYGLAISSMQSIWFGRTESIFGSDEDRESLISYTKKAVMYAKAIGCKNLVFGSPKNRNINKEDDIDIAIRFFRELGELASKHGVVIALEPNPTIYNTNFINKTMEAIRFVKKVNSEGLLVNVDFGTVIWNNEDLDEIFEYMELIHHIHISEPYLEKVEQRDIHKQLKNILEKKQYKNYVSIEMKNGNNIENVKNIIDYVDEVMR